VKSLEAIARTYNDTGQRYPRGTLIIEPIEGKDDEFKAVLHDRS